MIVGTLALLWAASGPLTTLLLLLAPKPNAADQCICGGMLGAASRYAYWSDCPVHQMRFNSVTNWWMLGHPWFSLFAVIGFLVGNAVGITTYECAPTSPIFHFLSDNCYGGVPWP
jgi:hypothetical protein